MLQHGGAFTSLFICKRCSCCIRKHGRQTKSRRRHRASTAARVKQPHRTLWYVDFGSSAIVSFRRLVSTAIGATALVSVRDLVPSKVCFGLCESALNIDTQARVTPSSTEKNLRPRCHQLRKVIQAPPKKICVSTLPHKRQVAMAPESCGDKVVVVTSPYKSDTHSPASIQLGQHKFKTFAANLALRSRRKVGLGSKLHAASSLELSVAALLLRLTLRWTGNTDQ